MSWEASFDARGCSVMRRAIGAALLTGVLSSSELLLASVSDPEGPISHLFGDASEVFRRHTEGRERPETPVEGGVVFDLYAGQAIASAETWALSRSERVSPEHLLVVLIDQASQPVTEELARQGIDAGFVRQAALGAMGLDRDQPPIPLTSLPPAGTVGRPPLPLSALPESTLAELRRRLERLPLDRLHKERDWFAIRLNEQRAVWRLTDRLGLSDDERYSLLCHHGEEVQRRAATAAPNVVPVPRHSGSAPHMSAVLLHLSGGKRRPVRRRCPHHVIPVGWNCWFGNRRVNLRARWLRLTVQH